MAERVDRVLRCVSSSTVPYLSVVVVFSILSGFLQYLTNGGPWVKGQPAGVVVAVIGLLVAIALWTVLRDRLRAEGQAAIFIAAVGLVWALHAVLARVHGDLTVYSIWVIVPILVMIYLKTPTPRELLAVLRVMGWTWIAVLVATRVLELGGVIPIFALPDFVLRWDQAHYWLPFSGHFGLVGRWPGPFRHPNEVGEVAALLVVLAGVVKGRSAWVFGTVGVLALLLAGMRAGYVSAAVGVLVLVVFGRNRVAQRTPLKLRLAMSMTLVAVIAAVMLRQSASLSGRTISIWPAFMDLWREHPWLGAGGRGMLENGGFTAIYLHGHSLVVDELARNGIVGMTAVALLIVFTATVAVRALLRGNPEPAAIVACYLTLGLSHTPADWLAFSPPLLLLFLTTLLAITWRPTEGAEGRTPSPQGSGRAPLVEHGPGVESVEGSVPG